MGLRDGLIHHYEFENDVGVIPDLVGSSDLTIIGVQIPAIPGKIDNAGDFRTTQDYAHFAGDMDIGGVDAFSVMSWLRTPPGGTGNRRAWISQQGTGSYVRASIGSTQRPFVQHFNDSETLTVVAPEGVTFTQDAWVHYGYTFERGVGSKLWMNGKFIISAPQTVDEASIAGANGFNIQARDGFGGGLPPGAEPLDGSQDQFLIYDRALSASEVNQLWNGGKGLNLVTEVSMVTSVTADVIQFTAAGDQILQPVVPQSVRFVADPASLAGDVIELVDPVTSGVLWSGYAGGVTGTEAELMSSGSLNSRVWPNGVQLGTLTGDRGTVYVRYV